MLPTFEVFGIAIPMFGVMMMCGMLAAFILLTYTRKFIRFTEDQLISAALWSILLGFLGAKLLFWIVEIDNILADPYYLIETLRSGFVFYGSLIGGVIGLWIYAARKKLPFLAFVDLFVPSLVLGQAFGRIGCFFAGCCYGSPSNCAIAVTYPPGGGAPADVALLPTQLMESAFLFLLTVALVLILKKHKPFGSVTGWYLVLYGVWRFIIEFFRSDERGAVGALSTSQFIGIFIVLAGGVLLTLIYRKVLTRSELEHPADPEADEPLFAPEESPDDVTQDEMVLLVSKATKAAERAASAAETAQPAANGQDAAAAPESNEAAREDAVSNGDGA